jgi:hypothetical protein
MITVKILNLNSVKNREFGIRTFCKTKVSIPEKFWKSLESEPFAKFKF